MADTKISLLTSAGALAGTEPLPIVQGGVTKKTTVQDVANLKVAVTTVTAGTNISVTGTSTAPIINSLSDRYKTSSVTSNTIGNGAKTFTVDANLAYIPLQEVLIVYDPSNHMHGEVTSYNNVTGALVVDVKNHTGGGTYASWVINLDGTPVDAITGVGTANEIAYFTSGQVIASLPVATYPSLTELSYVRGVTSAIQTQLNAKKDTILVSIMGTIITSPLDSTSYHFGIQPWTPNTTAAFRAFKFTDAGTIEKFSFALSQTINGSNQTVTIYLRNVTTSTDNLIGTFTSDFGASTTLKTLITSLSISVNTTDDWTLKILTPAWGTNPSDWVFGGTLSLTKS
jgi:hypothetical protein